VTTIVADLLTLFYSKTAATVIGNLHQSSTRFMQKGISWLWVFVENNLFIGFWPIKFYLLNRLWGIFAHASIIIRSIGG
jgi:hypothetical protein